MKRILFAVCQFFCLLAAFSCEEKSHIIEADSSQSSLLSAARRSFESDFTDFDFKRFKIQPQWDKAVKLQGNVVEVPFYHKGKAFKPRLKDYTGAMGGAIARLILSRKGQETVAEVMYYFPSAAFSGDVSELNLRNYKALKFDGVFMYQRLGEEEMHIRSVVNGKIIEKKLGVKVPEAKNGRMMECQLWGMFLDHYENGVLVESELLYTFQVCNGSGHDQDQAPPEPGGGNPEHIGPVNQQLLVNAKAIFGWMTGHSELSFILDNLEGCNVNVYLSSPLGPPNLQSSYTVGSSVAGSCFYGGWTPTNNQILAINPACSGCQNYFVETQHGGNLIIDTEAQVNAVVVSVGGVVKITQSYANSFGWQR